MWPLFTPPGNSLSTAANDTATSIKGVLYKRREALTNRSTPFLDHRRRDILLQGLLARQPLPPLSFRPVGAFGKVGPSSTLQVRAVGALQQNGRTDLGTGLQKTSPEVCQNGNHRLIITIRVSVREALLS